MPDAVAKIDRILLQVPFVPQVELDEEALRKYTVEKADHALPRRLIKVCRPSGVDIYFTTPAQNWGVHVEWQPAGG